MSRAETTTEASFFDPVVEVRVTGRRLPHWGQAGTMCFITWRTWDSLPRAVLEEWIAQRNDWLSQNGIDPHSANQSELLGRLPETARREFRTFVSERWEASLDRCHRSCPLRQPDCLRIVTDSLRHFDGVRYELFDFVVMPNHVHLLVAFPDPASMTRQCESWKRYTAVRANKLLGRRGRFWEEDSFDHLVRSTEQFEHLRRYVAFNPRMAGVRDGEYAHYSKPITE